MIHLAITGLVGLLLQATPAAKPVDALVKQEAQRITDSATKWRFTLPYYDRKKQSFVCRTVDSSGDKQADRVFCKAMASCSNLHKDEESRLMNMKGDGAAIDAAARAYYRKRNLCFRTEAAPLIDQLAAARVSKVARKR